VDFIWINRDQHSFEWFVRLMAQLELQQQSLAEDPEDPFLELQLYMTAAASRNDMKGLGLQMAMEIMHRKDKRDVITGLKTRTQAGRPNWKQVCISSVYTKMYASIVYIALNYCNSCLQTLLCSADVFRDILHYIFWHHLCFQGIPRLFCVETFLHDFP
jgi:hypothetical protein